MKYWGKRDVALNLPATGSISVTLDRLSTRTIVSFDDALEQDEFHLNDHADPRKGARVAGFLQLVRDLSGIRTYAHVDSQNDFPTGAGLASSASGFAALALACNAALELGLSPAELSVLARRGSGSAARSLFGGFVEMYRGEAADGSDAFAVPLAPPEHVPLRMVVAVTTSAEKSVGSTQGMRLTAETSPYYTPWVEAAPADLTEMRAAIAAHDLEHVGTLAESNCLRMHAVMLGARPPLLYWNAATVGAIEAVHDLRRRGVGAWFTIDAGPQVKVLCARADVEAVTSALAAVAGVQELLQAGPGVGAHLVGIDSPGFRASGTDSSGENV